MLHEIGVKIWFIWDPLPIDQLSRHADLIHFWFGEKDVFHGLFSSGVDNLKTRRVRILIVSEPGTRFIVPAGAPQAVLTLTPLIHAGVELLEAKRFDECMDRAEFSAGYLRVMRESWEEMPSQSYRWTSIKLEKRIKGMITHLAIWNCWATERRDKRWSDRVISVGRTWTELAKDNDVAILYDETIFCDQHIYSDYLKACNTQSK